jgi:hypothetical protein
MESNGGIDYKDSIPPAYVAWLAGTIIIFVAPRPDRADRLHRLAESIPGLLTRLEMSYKGKTPSQKSLFMYFVSLVFSDRDSSGLGRDYGRATRPVHTHPTSKQNRKLPNCCVLTRPSFCFFSILSRVIAPLKTIRHLRSVSDPQIRTVVYSRRTPNCNGTCYILNMAGNFLIKRILEEIV